MSGDCDIFESLGLDPPNPAREPDEVCTGIVYNDSEDVDVFVALGLDPLPNQPVVDPLPEKKPKRVRRMSSFEAAWEPAERYAKMLAWRERSAKTLLFDEPLYDEGDPYDREPHCRPLR
jgi:hypothetical protein